MGLLIGRKDKDDLRDASNLELLSHELYECFKKLKDKYKDKKSQDFLLELNVDVCNNLERFKDPN